MTDGAGGAPVKQKRAPEEEADSEAPPGKKVGRASRHRELIKAAAYRSWATVDRSLPVFAAERVTWDADSWLEAFTVARIQMRRKRAHLLRVMAAAHTVVDSLREPFRDMLVECAVRTKYHEDSSIAPLPLAPRGSAGSAEDAAAAVWRGDCLQAALVLQSEGYNPVLLNMANQFGAGGGWAQGDGAQEENMFRRTGYWASLVRRPSELSAELLQGFEDDVRQRAGRPDGWCYPLHEFGTVYSPDVVVLKGEEAFGYPTLPKARTMSFIASAAYRNPPCSDGPEFAYPDDVAAGMRRKMESILSTAIIHGHDCVVLSAFGCGAFNNPPSTVARLFAEVLRLPRYAGSFRR
eukprot:gene23004-35251_t